MDPINYGVDVQTPFQAALQGYQSGAAIRNEQLQREQQEAALKRQQQQQADLQAAASDHSLLPQMMVRYPEMAEKLRHGWDAMNTEQQRNTLGDASQVYFALQGGRPDVGAQRLKDRAAAMRASGKEEDAKALDAMAEQALRDPQDVAFRMAARISALPGGDKVIAGIGQLGQERRAAEQAPSALAKAQADAAKAGSDAKTAAVTAKYADSAALADLEKKGWDVKKIVADIDIAKQQNRIAAMNAAISREGNDLKRQELKLKIDDAITARDAKVREKVATAETGAASIDNMLNTIERIKKNPRLDDVVGGIEGRLPGVKDESVDAIALIETLGSQAFLAQIPSIKGMGALSNAEGDKLQAALQNLTRKQSEAQFRTSLDEAARLLKKGRSTLEKSSGIPLGKPDTPAAPAARPPLSYFQR